MTCGRKQSKIEGMKTIDVVAAVIRRENRIFATQRGYGEFKDGWEFPGGKIEKGESPEEALKREIREELATEIAVGEKILTVEQQYPSFFLRMHCYWAEIVTGDLELKEAENACWLSKKDLYSVDWLPADIEVVKAVEKHLTEEE